MTDTSVLIKRITSAKACKSLMKKYVTKEAADELKDKVTSLKGTLGDCIKSGVENLDSGVGIYACDPDAYTTFATVFDNVIRDYHKIPSDVTISHPTPHFGNQENLGLGDLDPEGKHVVSTRVRVGRSFDGYSFPPTITNESRQEIENKMKDIFGSFDGTLTGEYHGLVGMDEETRQKLVDDHFLFKDDDRFLRSAGGYNDWPNGRGIFFNKEKTFLVWVNEEDHLRLISMQSGGNLEDVFKRLVSAINLIEAKMKFARTDKHGYLTFCPTNLGTTLRASVHMKIPKVAALSKFQNICDGLNIQARGIDGEHTESVGGVYDLSNKRRLGLTEYDAVSEMARGVKVLLAMEQSLE